MGCMVLKKFSLPDCQTENYTLMNNLSNGNNDVKRVLRGRNGYFRGKNAQGREK